MYIGISSMMVFPRLPSILFAWRAVHEKRIESKPFMFAQNFSVCECKFQLSNAVHRVTLSSRWDIPWNWYRDIYSFKWVSLSKPKKLRTASYELVAIKTDESLTLVHSQNKQTSSQSSGKSRPNLRAFKGLFTRREGHPSKQVKPSWRAKDSPGLQANFHR